MYDYSIPKVVTEGVPRTQLVTKINFSRRSSRVLGGIKIKKYDDNLYIVVLSKYFKPMINYLQNNFLFIFI